MKGKMWCLINKKTGKIIKLWVGGFGSNARVLGYVTKKDILKEAEPLEHEEIRKIEFEY